MKSIWDIILSILAMESRAERERHIRQILAERRRADEERIREHIKQQIVAKVRNYAV